MIMLLTSVRDRPWRSLETRSSFGRVTSRLPSSPFSIEMGLTTVCVRVPLGPFTVTSWPVMLTSTPAGTGIGSRPIRDIASPPSLPDVGEHFAADALAGRLTVGEQAVRGRDDGDAEAAEDARQAGGLRVHAKTRLADPLDPGDGALAVRAELQLDGELLAHLRVLHGPGGDVALLLEDLADVRLDLARRH